MSDRAVDAVSRCLNGDGEVAPSRSREFYVYLVDEVLAASAAELVESLVQMRHIRMTEEALKIIEWGLFGTTDGELLGDDEVLPVGELRRLLREEVVPTFLARAEGERLMEKFLAGEDLG